MSMSTDGTFCDEFDRLHGRVFNAVTNRYDRPLRLQVPYWFRRLFRSRALRLSEMPGHGFIKRGMQWPRVVEAPVDPEWAVFKKKVVEHVRLCVECDDQEALSELHAINLPKSIGPMVIDGFIKDMKAKWSKLRVDYGYPV